MSNTDNEMSDRMFRMEQDQKDIKTATSMARGAETAFVEYQKECGKFLGGGIGSETMARMAVFFMQRLRSVVAEGEEEAITAEHKKAEEVRVPARDEAKQERWQKAEVLRKAGFVVEEGIVHYGVGGGNRVKLSNITDVDAFIKSDGDNTYPEKLEGNHD